MNISPDKNWTTIITADRRWFDINIKELWQYRDLIALFVRRDFVALYKQTILGPLWCVLQPLISTIIFTFIFGFVAKIPTDGLPPLLFYLSGIVLWNYFSVCLTKTSDLFVANAAIFGKVYFPRLSVPISIAITSLFTLAIQTTMFIAFLLFFLYKGAAIQPNIYIVFVPFVILMVGIMGIGFGIIISSVTTRFRDLSLLTGFGMQLWMYASPVVYPLSQVPEKARPFYALNPLTGPIEFIRFACLGVGTVSEVMIISSVVITALVLVLGLSLFSRIEKTFIDTI